jgi:hypothetical protein
MPCWQCTWQGTTSHSRGCLWDACAEREVLQDCTCGGAPGAPMGQAQEKGRGDMRPPPCSGPPPCRGDASSSGDAGRSRGASGSVWAGAPGRGCSAEQASAQQLQNGGCADPEPQAAGDHIPVLLP